MKFSFEKADIQEVEKMKYDIEWYVNDNGAQVRRLILHLPESVDIKDVTADCFSVYVERRDEEGKIIYTCPVWYKKEIKKSSGYRKILAAYPCDAGGEAKCTGEYVALEMDMEDFLSRTIVGTLDSSKFIDTIYRVTQIREIGELAGLVFDELGEIRCPQTKRWAHGRSSYVQLPLQFGYYSPDTEDTRPLIIWLHGAGEGGQDPRTAYMGNNVVALSSSKIQEYFGGAWVLVPQCPTMWMDDGTHTYGHTGQSMYCDALKALIDEFVENHAVDRKRIYIGGCSNGGFMTMRMVIDYPDYFAGAYPMCEALYDDTISDEQIQAIRHVPIWMLHAMTDKIVDPEETSVPTYKRLVSAGAGNIHLTYINDRPPFPMVDHGCWTIGLNDEENYDFNGQPVIADGKEVTRFQWLAAQKRE